MVKGRRQTPPPVAPTKTPEVAIPLLKRQLERLNEVESLRWDDPKVNGWESTTINLLNEVYGEPNGRHRNTSDFDNADDGGAWVNMSNEQLQQAHRKRASSRRALLEAYIEQLTDSIGGSSALNKREERTAPADKIMNHSLKKGDQLKSTFAIYSLSDRIGEGGSGVVYSATDGDGNSVAIKILNPDKATRDKLKRFKNEFRFCSQNNHPHIVKVTDHGLTAGQSPFFVMPLYKSSLRKLMGTLSHIDAFGIFKKIMDGVDAAHKQGVTHRDLKPENILVNGVGADLVVADFGIADFEEDEIFTAVETRDNARLANFQYAAPEQRARGKVVDRKSDVYALGLILNELFTSELALGTNFKTIGSVASDYAYLDSVVEKMLEQSPSARYSDIDELKSELMALSDQQLSRQKVSKLNGSVIPAAEVDDPIVADPMRVIGGDWENGVLTIQLNHQPNPDWIWSLNNMGSHTSVLGKGPEAFKFAGKSAKISADKNEAQRVIDYFKQWLPMVERVYKGKLERNLKEIEQKQKDETKRRIAEEEERMRVKSTLRF